MIQITDTIVLDDREIKERFVRATGPDGQNINISYMLYRRRPRHGVDGDPPAAS